MSATGDGKLAAAIQVLDDPACCKDESFTVKLCKLLANPHQLCEGPVYEMLASCAGDISVAIADLEAMHAVNRNLANCKKPPTVGRVRNESFIRAWVREHERMGNNMA